MKNRVALLVLFSTAVGFVRSDPNIYGPNGVNLGPNPDSELVFPELQQNKIREKEREQARLLEEEREQTRLLQQQVQKLEQMQEQMLWNMQNQNPSQIQIQIPGGYNYGNPTYGNFGWGGWGGWGSGIIVSPGLDRHHGGGHHRHKRDGGHSRH